MKDNDMSCLPETGSSLLGSLLIAGVALVVLGIAISVIAGRSTIRLLTVIPLLAMGLTLALGQFGPAKAWAAEDDCPVPSASAVPSPAQSNDVSPPPDVPPPVAFAAASLAWSAPSIPAENACTPDPMLPIFPPAVVGTSPDISWTNAPAGTVAYAVRIIDITTDPDYRHWTVINIPATETGLAAGASPGGMPLGSQELVNDAFIAGYLGPCPPSGETHTYEIHVHALSQTVIGEADIAAATLAEFTLTNTYTAP